VAAVRRLTDRTQVPGAPEDALRTAAITNTHDRLAPAMVIGALLAPVSIGLSKPVTEWAVTKRRLATENNGRKRPGFSRKFHSMESEISCWPWQITAEKRSLNRPRSFTSFRSFTQKLIDPGCMRTLVSSPVPRFKVVVEDTVDTRCWPMSAIRMRRTRSVARSAWARVHPCG